MTRTFGGVKIVARPVGASISERMPVADWPKSARPRHGPSPDALDYAAWYLAGVLCEQSSHEHEYGDWPCKRSLDFAVAQMHVLASTKIPSLSKEKPHAKGQNATQESGEKSGRKSGRKSGGSRRRQAGNHVRPKR